MVYMPHWPQVLGKRPIDLDLIRIKALMEVLGNPHLGMAPIIHVAGTNGKGSTVAFLKAILKAAGLKVQTYTSPHLVEFNERIDFGDRTISDAELFEVIELCRLACEEAEIHPTVFEGTTAAAFVAFSRHDAHVCILETGLGGRMDATNLFPQPDCTIITPISMDHMDYLGNTIEEIAFEKAGIIKPGAPCIVSQQLPEVMEVIRQRANECGAPLWEYGKHWMVTQAPDGLRYVEAGYELLFPQLSLAGVHQYLNAGCAIAASRRAIRFDINDQQRVQGLQTAHWPGRLQRITSGRLVASLPQDWELWMDGGHNPGGAEVLARWISDNNDKPTCLITGMTKGKDSSGFFAPMVGKVTGVCGFCVKSEPNSQPADMITQAAGSVGLEAQSRESLDEAIHYLVDKIKEPSRILICGSLFLVGDVLKENGKL
ncbi:MAG: bifunctional folylpolyglutamate synthase/dihydrofolate synthase [Alphaproteobacteria bacterium]|nr:bifunctional folylpolyglutamate synthase/dihydrofolate synthase [Alphaproteobacteria bacterium]